MALYQQFLDFNSLEELVKAFQDCIIVTNRTADFFVDWCKVQDNAETLKVELSLMNSLVGSKNFESDFKDLIKKYPEALRVIPILIAVRDLEFPVIIDFHDIEKGVKELDFNKTHGMRLSEEEVEEYYRFVKNSGLTVLFDSVSHLYDYVFGVEVGMDTNARKNRSGEAMEQLMKPVIENIAKELGAKCLFQKKFKDVNLSNCTVPGALSNRKTDFIVYTDERFVNIEVNYYSGAGSKPEEIVDSYINRKNELEENEWDFIWITDGRAWKGSESQLTKAFNNMDYVLNIKFSNRGLLKAALKKILQS